MIGRGLKSGGAGLARVCAIAAALSMIACTRRSPENASADVECRPVQREALETGFGPYRRNTWGSRSPRYDQLALGEVVLLVARGADACLELTDSVGESGADMEAPLIAIRLSDDGRTLWINNQLDELLGFDVFVRIGDGVSRPASSCPVAPHSVVELSFDEPVENASLSRFRFRSATDPAEPDPDCNPP
jgi:hypothetical protein